MIGLGGRGLRVGLVAHEDPLSELTWSGIPFQIARALQAAGHQVIAVEPPRYDRWVRRIDKRTLYLKWSFRFTALVRRLYGQSARRSLRAQDVDVVIGFVAPDILYELTRDYRTVHVSDATFRLAWSYYAVHFKKYGSRSLRDIDRSESRALSACDLIMVASSWAARSVTGDYGVSPDRVLVCPLGAGFPYVSARALAAGDQLELLWCGVDWVRKGGDLVVATFRRLRDQGLNVKLHLVGPSSYSAEALDDPDIATYGFLSKADARQAQTLSNLYERAHFLVLPSRVEAFGMVFCEAAAFATPVVAYDTGGVGSVVLDGQTGRLLPLSAGPDEFARAIAQDWTHRPRWEAMARAARARYETILNWDHWVSEFETAVAPWLR